MDEEVSNDSLPYLKELENKIGRKMPESLLVWMRDAAEWGDFGRSGEGGELGSGLGDSFSEKISTLKQEMVNVPSGFYTGGDFVPWKSPVFPRLLGILNNLHDSFSPVFILRTRFLRCTNVSPFWSTCSFSCNDRFLTLHPHLAFPPFTCSS